MKLSEIAEINPRREVLEDKDTVSFIAMEDITNNGRVINKTDKLYEEVKKGYTPFKDNDVLLAKITPCFENGKRALVGKLSNGIGFGSTEFHVLRANKESISKFLYYVISSHRFMSKAENNMTGSAGQKRVPTEFIKDYVLAVPTIKEQEKIASILSTIDEQIDNVDALIEKNKELKKGLMQTLLTKGIGHTKFKKTEIGEIPEEWHWGKLSNYVELKHGYQFRKEDFTDCGVPIVKISQISMRGKLELKDLTYISSNRENDFKDIIIKNGDILLALSGATVGKVALVKDLNGIYLQNYRVGKLICNDSLVNEYVFHYINSEIFYEQLMKLTNTSAQPNFGKQDMDKILITVPSKKEQQKIASILSKVDEKIDMYENKKQKLEELKKGLMQQLLTGKIRVI